MTLYELESKLRIARQQGAEDNAAVVFDVPTPYHIDNDSREDHIHAEGELNIVAFERASRHEIVLR